MGITVGHVKSLTMGDTTNTNMVRPSDWNSGHNVTISLSSTDIVRSFVANGTSVSTGQAISLAAGPSINWSASTDTNGATFTPLHDAIPFYEYPKGPGTSGSTNINGGSLFLFPFDIDCPITFGRLELAQTQTVTMISTLSLTMAASNNTWASSYTTGLSVSTGRTAILFSRSQTGSLAGSSRLVSFASASASMGLQFAMSVSGSKSVSTTAATTMSMSCSETISLVFPEAINATGGVTYSTLSLGNGSSSGTTSFNTASHSWTMSYSTSLLHSWMSGYRMFEIPMGSSLPEGEYWLGLVEVSGAAGAGNVTGAMSLVGITRFNSSGAIPFGQSTSNASNAWRAGWGSYSASADYSNATGIALSNVSEMSRFQVSFALRLDSL